MLVIDDDDIIKVHIHTNHPGEVLEEALKLGEMINIKIDNMKHQHKSIIDEAPKPAYSEAVTLQGDVKKAKQVKPDKEFGFAAVCAGKGFSKILKDLGIDIVIEGGQTMNPSTNDILKAVRKIKAKNIFVFPNNKNIIMAAEQAEKLADRKVLVLPTRTVPQGMTAMLNFDPEAAPEENAVNMMAAAEKVATGLITYAARDSEFDGRPIRKGEIMALENGKIVATGSDITKMTYRLARSMKKKDSQFITVISGAEVSEEDAEHTTELVQSKCGSSVEVSHIHGGQPVYYYMLSVE